MAAIPFHGIQVRYGTESLYFSCTVQRIVTGIAEDNPLTEYVDESTDTILITDGLGTAQTATDSAAITANPNLGVRNLSITGLLLAADQQCKNLAEHLVSRYSTAEAVITAVTFKLNGMSTADRAIITALDQTDILSIAWTPANTGSTVLQTLLIEGVTYQATAGGIASVTFDLSTAQSDQVFTLDSATLGVLDTDVLAY